MSIKYWSIENENDYKKLYEAAEMLKNGKIIAFPSETVYGLGGNALDSHAVSQIFLAKNRPADNPLIVHIAELLQIYQFVETLPPIAEKLISSFCPGPLTLILPAKENVLSPLVVSGLKTVAIRMPRHKIARKLLKIASIPIAAPSANRSGKPSPTDAKHVLEDLSNKIDGIIDGGKTFFGIESTVINCSVNPPVILRLGAITQEEIESCLGTTVMCAAPSESNTPLAPGMKYKHYAPDMPFILVDGKPMFIQKLIDQKRANKKKVGVLTVIERENYYNADFVSTCGSEHDLASVAANIYEALRSFNAAGVDIIYGEVFLQKGIGKTIMNRLTKAANGKIIYQ